MSEAHRNWKQIHAVEGKILRQRQIRFLRLRFTQTTQQLMSGCKSLQPPTVQGSKMQPSPKPTPPTTTTRKKQIKNQNALLTMPRSDSSSIWKVQAAGRSTASPDSIPCASRRQSLRVWLAAGRKPNPPPPHPSLAFVPIKSST